MITRRSVPTSELVPGMQADRDIDDRLGRNLIARGAILDERLIEGLKKLEISSIYIREEIPDEEIETEADEALIQEALDQYHVSDPTTVALSDSVRKRVSEGIQFIYNDIHSEELTDTANSITSDLMGAITSNNAVAIDISTLKTSDEYTFKHSVDVATIAMILAKHLGFTHKEVYDIGVSGLLHDIGKAEIPLDILNKPGRLSDEEFEVMKSHPIIGYHSLQEHGTVSAEVALGVLQHHEKKDGSGYPLHLPGDKINRFAKILAVADIYDALVTERPYKTAFSQRDAVEMIMAMTGELDMDAMQAFLHTIILYPVDSIVQLSNGEHARVLHNHPNYLLRPTVVGLKSGKVYNLAEDLSCANVIIL